VRVCWCGATPETGCAWQLYDTREGRPAALLTLSANGGVGRAR